MFPAYGKFVWYHARYKVSGVFYGRTVFKLSLRTIEDCRNGYEQAVIPPMGRRALYCADVGDPRCSGLSKSSVLVNSSVASTVCLIMLLVLAYAAAVTANWTSKIGDVSQQAIHRIYGWMTEIRNLPHSLTACSSTTLIMRIPKMYVGAILLAPLITMTNLWRCNAVSWWIHSPVPRPFVC
jgi:hypothetical protein